jgi:hypothetical protein
VRLHSRNANIGPRDCQPLRVTEQIKAKSFTIDGEAVVLGPDGLSRFEELPSREAARAYAFDLIELDGEDRRNLPFLATFRRKIPFFRLAVNRAAQSKARRGVTGGLKIV